jgi:hypothetical protein
MSAHDQILLRLGADGPTPAATASALLAERDSDLRSALADLVRSFIPKCPQDDEGKAVAYALNLAANAVERGRR